MKTVKLLLSIVLLSLVSNTFADNLVVEDFSITPGGTKTISIELDNPDSQYIMVEFWMSLPDGVSIPMDEDGYYMAEGNSSRFTKTHSLEVSKQGGFYHFLIFSSRNAAIKGNSGELISVTIEAAPDAQVGTYTAKIFNQLYNDPNKNEVTPDDVIFNITIGSSDYPMGDVDHNGYVNVTDVMMAVNYFIGQSVSGFYLENADFDKDSVITVSEIMQIVNIALQTNNANTSSFVVRQPPTI